MAFCISGNIYVAGGIEFDVKRPRCRMIEEYHEDTNKWQLIDLKLPEGGLESAVCLVIP